MCTHSTISKNIMYVCMYIESCSTLGFLSPCLVRFINVHVLYFNTWSVNISLPHRLSNIPNIFSSFLKIPSTEHDEDSLLITPISNKIQNEKWAEKFLNSH